MCRFTKIECLSGEDKSIQNISDCGDIDSICIEIRDERGDVKKVRFTPECLDSMIEQQILQPK
jgi:hypothetical protein